MCFTDLGNISAIVSSIFFSGPFSLPLSTSILIVHTYDRPFYLVPQVIEALFTFFPIVFVSQTNLYSSIFELNDTFFFHCQFAVNLIQWFPNLRYCIFQFQNFSCIVPTLLFFPFFLLLCMKIESLFLVITHQ